MENKKTRYISRSKEHKIVLRPSPKIIVGDQTITKQGRTLEFHNWVAEVDEETAKILDELLDNPDTRNLHSTMFWKDLTGKVNPTAAFSKPSTTINGVKSTLHVIPPKDDSSPVVAGAPKVRYPDSGPDEVLESL